MRTIGAIAGLALVAGLLVAASVIVLIDGARLVIGG